MLECPDADEGMEKLTVADPCTFHSYSQCVASKHFLHNRTGWLDKVLGHVLETVLKKEEEPQQVCDDEHADVKIDRIGHDLGVRRSSCLHQTDPPQEQECV